MSNWTHMLCDACWDAVEPMRTPVRLKNPQLEVCCKCGTLVVGAIPYRMDPESASYCDHDGEVVKDLLNKVAFIPHLVNHQEELAHRIWTLEQQLNPHQQETTQ